MRAVLGILLVLATSAHAGPPTVKVTVALADRARPVQLASRDISTLKPDVDADQALSIEELVGNIRPEQEQILADLIANTPDSQVEEKSNYYFMLGALQAKLHRHWRQKSVELAIQADRSKNAKTKAEAEKAAENAKLHLLKMMKAYKGLTDNEAFRNYPKMDMALFFYGYTLRSGQYLTEARQVFDRLLKNHPQSKYVPEAHLVFADYFFEKGQLADAEARYRMILKFPKSAVYWYAMYKLGWIHMNLQRFQEALETFFQIAQATKNDLKQEPLNRASLEDFVRAYAEIGKPDKASAAFQRVDSKRALEMLQVLAHRYLEQGKGDRAIWIYQELLRTAPADENACEWRYNIARATAYNAATAQQVEVCTQDVGTLKEWARVNGVTVSCPSCAPDKKRP
jgi:TolA-binding protein